MTRDHDYNRYLRLARKSARSGDPVAATRWTKLAELHKPLSPTKARDESDGPEADDAEGARLRAQLDELATRLRRDIAEAEAVDDQGADRPSSSP